MRRAAIAIIRAYGEQRMGVDLQAVASGGCVDSGAKVVDRMERSAVMAAVERLPTAERLFVLLTYTDQYRGCDRDQAMGELLSYVFMRCGEYGAPGKVSLSELVSTTNAVYMMLDNAINKTRNGTTPHDKQAIRDVLGVDRSQFDGARKWGLVASAVDKITADFDASALDAVDAVLPGKNSC